MTTPRLYKQIFTPPASVIGPGSITYTTVSASSNNVNLPTGTINVSSTAGFPTSGSIGVQVIVNNSTTYTTVNYTNTNSTQFLGCTGGTGTIFTGYQIGLIGSILVGTWTAPAGIKWVTLTGCGGGGGGGGGASCSGRSQTYFAGGGGGGFCAPTITQIISVTPGVVYNVSIGEGGIGGTSNCVANIVNGGGTRPGNQGSDGSATIFGSNLFPGGKGGREGYLISINSLTFVSGSDCGGVTLSGSSNPSASNIQNQTERVPFTTAGSQQGIAHAVNRSSGQYSYSGGGTAGGTSNNVYSSAGGGGQGAQGFDGYPFAGYGGNGIFGAGGGGGGGGEGWDYNNTHDGGFGGWGGSGFLEVAWVA